MSAHVSPFGVRRAAAATAVLAVLLSTGCGVHRAAPAGAPAGPAPAPAAAPMAQNAHSSDLPGVLYYVTQADRVVRSTGSGPVTVLRAGGSSAVVSPDGRSIAYLTATDHTNTADDTGTSTLVVTDRDGRHPRTVLRHVLDSGSEPSWSADSARLFVVRAVAGHPVPGVVNATTGAFTTLEHRLDGIHYLWSADGRHMGYATGECRIGIADAHGGNARLVPVIGVQDRTMNPDARRSCDPYSVSTDGSRMAVRLTRGDEPDGDVARSLTANAVIDTRTGAVLPLPVTAPVDAVLFGADDSMLIRSGTREGYQLTLVSAGGVIIAQRPEPADVKRFSLLAHIAA